MPEFLTIRETAELLQLGERAVYEKLRGGKIPGAGKVAGKWRVHKQHLVEWMIKGGELQDVDDEDDDRSES